MSRADPGGECQTAGEQPPLADAEWSGLPRAADRDALTQAALNHREGAPLTALAQAAFGEANVTGGASYQLARRHYTKRPELFKTDKRDGLVWVQPTPDLLQRASLDAQVSKASELGESAQRARSNAEAMLDRRSSFSTPEEKGDLVGAFGAKREATEDRFHAFQDTFSREDHLLVPYSTRFNSERRVREHRSRYRSAWSTAAEEYREGVVVTLTTDPSRYDSLAGMAEGLLDDVNALKDWLAYDPENGPSRPGYRPPSVVSVEFTEDGKPHVHVAFFGVRWLTTHGALSGYWSVGRDRGAVVWVDRIRARSGRWVWAGGEEDRDHDDTGGGGPRGYLAESIDVLETSADMTAAEVQEAATALRAAGDGDDAAADVTEGAKTLFKAALYWATELPATTESDELKPDGGEGSRRATAPDGTPLPEDAPSRWRYVGTARYSEFPDYVCEGATVLRRGGGTVCRGEPPPR
jgi:hypothetical protein